MQEVSRLSTTAPRPGLLYLWSPPTPSWAADAARRLNRVIALHRYFGERARIKRSHLFHRAFFVVGKGGGGDMIVTRSEICVPGLAFSQKHHNLCRTVRGRTLGYELVFFIYLFCFFSFSFSFPYFLNGD
jgi:hypothetical protein